LSERRYRKYPRRSLRGPVTLFVIVLVMIVTLTVLWNFSLVHDYQQLRKLAQEATFHGAFIAMGSALFVAIIVLSSILAAQLFEQIRFSQKQSNFISSVSHELNSPLSAIKLFAQTLRKQDLALADRLDFVEKILFDVDRLHRLIANILRAAEMDHRGQELQVVVQNVELGEYLRRYLVDAEAIYRAQHLQLSLEAEGELQVRLDPLMFRQVLDNLLDNAVRYRGGGEPQVEITVERIDGQVEIRLRDRGAGIDPEDLPRLFDRFYRGRNVEPEGRRQGTGIGLYVVRSIVQAHGGKVGARSDGKGFGATLWIRLPLLKSSVGEEKK
jgi:signal transduction histidine kinase